MIPDLKHMQKIQAPKAVVMVRPHHFYMNEQTALDNSFQSQDHPDRKRIAKVAYDEVTNVAGTLERAGVKVHLFEDESLVTPDSAFPNNWFSTHGDGRLAFYPMFAPSRRLERRHDIIEVLKKNYVVHEVMDYSKYEKQEKFLEGTGSMVLDHIEKIAFMSLSKRSSETLLNKFCTDFGYQPFPFETEGPDGQPIYHTNVMLALGTTLALLGSGTIKDKKRAGELTRQLKKSGRKIIELSPDQISQFAGNALELLSPSGPILALSETARQSLTQGQIGEIESHLPLLPISVPTIELSGGSLRCMLAGIHLTKRV